VTGGAAGSAAAPPIWRRRWLVWLLTAAVVAEVCAGATGIVHVRAVARPGGVAAHATAPPGPRGGVDARLTTPALPGADGATGDDRTAEVRRLLDDRAAALRRRDRAGWLAGIDPRAAAFRARQAAVFDALAAVPLATWEYRLDPALQQSLGSAALRRYGAPVWTPDVTLRYSLRTVDAQPTERPMVFTFLRRGDRWYLANDADVTTDGARGWRGLWDFGRVIARRGRSSLVLAHPGHADRLAVFVQAVDEAVPAVTAVWGPGWRRQVAVLLPDTQAEMAALVGDRFALARIAAVAIADDVDTRSGSVHGQRVVVNPANLDRLGALSRQIVFRHEITHIASRAATSEAMPTWLIEGFADYVGYAGVGLPAGIVAPDLRAEIRAGTWSGALPADTDFTGDAPGLAVAYESGWSACQLIASRVGVAGLVRFYRLVGSGGPDGRAALDAALREVLHVTYAGFVAQWRSAVRAELG
jgi:hypothetical protein